MRVDCTVRVRRHYLEGGGLVRTDRQPLHTTIIVVNITHQQYRRMFGILLERRRTIDDIIDSFLIACRCPGLLAAHQQDDEGALGACVYAASDSKQSRSENNDMIGLDTFPSEKKQPFVRDGPTTAETHFSPVVIRIESVIGDVTVPHMQP